MRKENAPFVALIFLCSFARIRLAESCISRWMPSIWYP
jgi:hypothetical protein